MKKIVKARIHWLSSDAGGRAAPPTGPRYSTVARFEADTSDWSDIAWSIVAEFDVPPTASQETIARIWLLAHDRPGAPEHFLRPGSRFELFEGRKLVATGEVIDEL